MSLERDQEWFAKFKRYNRDMHEVSLVGDWETALRDQRGNRWSVVFVDQSPAAARSRSIEILKPHADVFVCHDSEHRLYNYEPSLTKFKYRKEWKRYAPWTAVVSDTNDLSFLDGLL